MSRRAAARWPGRRRPRPEPVRRSARRRRRWRTISRRSTSSGRVTAPARADRCHLVADAGQPEGAGGAAVAVVPDEIPAALLGDHAPRLDGAHGVRLGAGRAGAETARPARRRSPPAARPSTSSDPRSPTLPAGDAMAIGASGSTSTPAARSFSSAPWVAVISSGDSHSWVATATAAASSAVSSTAGSA